MRKHRNNSIYKVYTCSTLKRFSIKSRILLNIVSYIRNMNAEMVKSLLINRKTNCIIKVFGILTVYCDHLDIPKISSAKHIRFTYLIRTPVSLIYNSFRKFAWNIISFNYRHNVYSGIIDISYDLHNLTFRLLALNGISIISYLNNNFISCDSLAMMLNRNKDIAGNPAIIRNNEAKVLLPLIGSNNLIHSSYQNIPDTSFLSLTSRFRQKFNLNSIRMEGSVNILLRNKNIFISSLNFNEAKASGIGDKSTNNHFFILFA